jgi:hypothetical protein
MPLNKDARIEKISRLDDSKIVGKHKMEWDGINNYKDVYRVPTSYLVYNKYNGRILSRTKSLETQGQKLNSEIKKDFKIIEKLLFDSHPSRNRKTETSIRKKGQERPGIITKDGVVIDGNRRFMSLNRIANNPEKLDPEKFKYFEAVILPVNLADNPDAIRRLETTYQMGEDKKLDYNPIEKYLKAQELKKSRVSENDIAEWMGETKGDIAKYLNTMQTMDEYLDTLEYNGIYTQLDGREDWFISLTKWLESFRGEESKKAFDDYEDDDVNDLELICYDYIRAKHGGDGKRFRKIAEGLQPNHIFGNKELWEKFRNLHFENIKSIQDEEVTINHDSLDLKSHLDSRDNKFKKNSSEYLKENLNDRISELSNKQNQDKPERLINKAKDALKEVSVKAESFSKPDVQRQLKEVSSRVTELLSQNSVSLVLEQSLDLIKKIDIDILNNEDSDKRLDLVTQINRLTFKMKKELGG